MAIHIDEIDTQVQMESEPTRNSEAAATPPLWQQLAQLRQLQRQVLCDDARTAASGNQD